MSDRLIFKARLDPYYGPLLDAGLLSIPGLIDAGFFDDEMPGTVRHLPQWNPSILTTPLLKVRAHITKLARHAHTKPLVLLTTGGFSPVHVGHLRMMERARLHAESQGYTVVGGYMSPSHDSYVSVKAGGRAALHAETRIALLEEALHDSSWLSVCSWEARHAPCAVNFTDVLDRLQAYLDLHLKTPVKVAYVFGRDNLKFLDTFTHTGIGLCVPRDPLGGYVNLSLADQTWLKALRQGRESRIFLLEAVSDPEASSTRARQGATSLIPQASQARYLSHKDQVSPVNTLLPAYMVRQDLKHGVAPWNVPIAAEASFNQDLLELLKVAVAGHASVEPLALCAWEPSSADVSAHYRPTLSLDILYSAEAQLSLSRKFDSGGGQVASHLFVARPGQPSVPDQLETIKTASALWPNRPWRVVDDDEATGATRREVEKLLASIGIKVQGFDYLNNWQLRSEGFTDRSVYDVVDARDFLLGTQDGGLVVELPNGKLARAPYMFPFVNLVFRAKVPPPLSQWLSAQLWALNARWFETFAPQLNVADAAAGTKELLEYLGFVDSFPLYLCAQRLSLWSGCQWQAASKA